MCVKAIEVNNIVFFLKSSKYIQMEWYITPPWGPPPLPGIGGGWVGVARQPEIHFDSHARKWVWKKKHLLIAGIAMKNYPPTIASQQFLVMSPNIIWIITTVLIWYSDKGHRINTY